MNYDISELSSLNLDQLKRLCTKLGVSVLIERQDLISRLAAKLSQRTTTTEDIIKIKQEFSEDTLKANYCSNSNNNLQNNRAKSVASDIGTLNSDTSLNYEPDSSPLNSTSFTGSIKHTPASLNDNSSKKSSNIQNGKISSITKFSLRPTAIKEKNPISVAEELKRREKRAERFSSSTPSVKKTIDSSLVPSNLPVVSLTAVSSLSFEEKLRKRAERFGLENTIVSSKLASITPKPEKKPLASKPLITNDKTIELSKERKNRLFVEEEKSKLEARLKRFNVTPSSKIITKEDPNKLLLRSKRFKILE